jgi:hypothetical protein
VEAFGAKLFSRGGCCRAGKIPRAKMKVNDGSRARIRHRGKNCDSEEVLISSAFLHYAGFSVKIRTR